MAARQLGLLVVVLLQNITNAVQELHVALFVVLLKSRDKRIRHGACSLCIDGGIGAGNGELSD